MACCAVAHLYQCFKMLAQPDLADAHKLAYHTMSDALDEWLAERPLVPKCRSIVESKGARQYVGGVASVFLDLEQRFECDCGPQGASQRS